MKGRYFAIGLSTLAAAASSGALFNVSAGGSASCWSRDPTSPSWPGSTNWNWAWNPATTASGNARSVGGGLTSGASAGIGGWANTETIYVVGYVGAGVDTHYPWYAEAGGTVSFGASFETDEKMPFTIRASSESISPLLAALDAVGTPNVVGTATLVDDWYIWSGELHPGRYYFSVEKTVYVNRAHPYDGGEFQVFLPIPAAPTPLVVVTAGLMAAARRRH